MFCECPHCTEARRLGGKNIRRRSSLLLDRSMLIDLGPDVPAVAQELGIGMRQVQHVLITHCHDDHFLPIALRYRTRRKGLGVPPILTVYGSQPALERLRAIPYAFDDIRVADRLATAGEWLQVGDYRVLPLPANHAPNTEPLLFAIFQGDTGVLYATDTAAFPDETWNLLAPLRLSAVVLNCTLAVRSETDEDRLHLTLEENLDHVKRMRLDGILRPDGAALATHFSHRGQPDHETLIAQLAVGNVLPAYDGLELDI